MRYTRIFAAFVFAASLIFTFILPSSAVTIEPLVCEYGVGLYVVANSNLSKWEDFSPTVSNGTYTFSNIPNSYTSGNYEYYFNSFNFLCYNDGSSSIFLERGYIYTFNFTVTSNQVSLSNAPLTTFSFGMCETGYTNGLPLSSVTYTYDRKAGTTTYNCTAIVNVDESIDFSSLSSDEQDVYYYLQIVAPWSDTFTLTASNMSRTKKMGEEAYYQASIDAIENLPQTEYDYILNKMPDEQGYIDTISGDLTIMHNYFISHTDSIAYLYNYLETARPCMYIPDVKVPFFKDLNIVEDQIFYFDTYLNQMNAEIMPKVNIVVIAIRIFLVMTFLTTSIWKMVRVEWWL